MKMDAKSVIVGHPAATATASGSAGQPPPLLPYSMIAQHQSRHRQQHASAQTGTSRSGDVGLVKEYGGVYEGAQFANIFVEFENDTREMAVDVPDHFVATTKTPPKYPPPLSSAAAPYGAFTAGSSRNSSLSNGHTVLVAATQRNSSSSSNGGSGGCKGVVVGHSSVSSGNSRGVNNNKSLPSRDHLRIERDGTLRNTAEPPPIPSVPPLHLVNGSGAVATPEEAGRVRKYEESMARKASEEERRNAENEFLRLSLRNSQKLRKLEELRRNQQAQVQVDGGGFGGGTVYEDGLQLQDQLHPQHNPAFSHDEDDCGEDGGGALSNLLAALNSKDLVQSVERLRGDVNLVSTEPDLGRKLDKVRALFEDKRFQDSLKFAQKVERSLIESLPTSTAPPHEGDVQEVTEDCINYLAEIDSDDDDAAELRKLLSRNWIEGLLYAHDKIRGQAEASLEEAAAVPGSPAVNAAAMGSQPHLNNGVAVNSLGSSSNNSSFGPVSAATALVQDSSLLDRLSQYAEQNVRVVRIEKTAEPLGATVRNDGDSVVVARIIRGGTAEASGLLHEGDEILEVNQVELRGKDVNQVCEVLANMHGTLTFLVVPNRFPPQQQSQQQQQLSAAAAASAASMAQQQAMKTFPVVHIRAHIDYDPEDDPYLPCRELGISFQKGDILHVVNQSDPHWWQARRDGEEDLTLPGLVPSAHFLQQREAMKHTIALDVSGNPKSGESPDGKGWNHRTSSGSGGGGFLCGKRSGRRAKKRKATAVAAAGMAGDEDAADADIVTYEEVALYYPRAERKRPIVLVGPPNIGRHELRQRLMQDQHRFAAAVPHTSRPKRASEVDGVDYHFISKAQFKQDILSRRFVEHGEYEEAFYGTSLEAIRTVVLSSKICVLNLHPQSLKMLRASDLMPFVVFVSPPSLEKLKRWKMDHAEPIDDKELRDIIERAREMEEAYGHYFDIFITYSDPDRVYQQLLGAINSLEREPQWVPAVWLSSRTDL